MYFTKDLYSKALHMHIKALDYTSKYNDTEHKVEALTKCTEACFKLLKYGDAYTYCTKFVKFDPWNSKVGSYSYLHV
jgi:tetratricopeptide (TPR) repeat protein